MGFWAGFFIGFCTYMVGAVAVIIVVMALEGKRETKRMEKRIKQLSELTKADYEYLASK